MRRMPWVLPPALLIALTGCATPAGGDAASVPATPTPAVVAPSQTPDATAGVPEQVTAAWLDGGRLFGLVTYGSSSCVPAAQDATVTADGVVTVTVTDPGGTCTADYAPRVSLVVTPAGMDPSLGWAVHLAGDGGGGAVIDGVEGLSPGGETDYLPSAGWTGFDDGLVILTWGSSGCPPIVDAVTLAGPAEVAVAFQTPPADQVCTADIAARALYVTVDGLEDDVSAQLILSGGAEFPTPVTIPVYGRP